jgi:hypothetical protein
LELGRGFYEIALQLRPGNAQYLAVIGKIHMQASASIAASTPNSFRRA